MLSCLERVQEGVDDTGGYTMVIGKLSWFLQKLHASSSAGRRLTGCEVSEIASSKLCLLLHRALAHLALEISPLLSCGAVLCPNCTFQHITRPLCSLNSACGPHPLFFRSTERAPPSNASKA